MIDDVLKGKRLNGLSRVPRQHAIQVFRALKAVYPDPEPIPDPGYSVRSFPKSQIVETEIVTKTCERCGEDFTRPANPHASRTRYCVACLKENFLNRRRPLEGD